MKNNEKQMKNHFARIPLIVCVGVCVLGICECSDCSDYIREQKCSH